MGKDDADKACQQRLCRQKQEFLDKYACYDGYKYYKGQCGPPKTACDFKISDHPDFKNYVPKSELETRVKSEVDKRNNLPIEQHPDYAKLKLYFKELFARKVKEVESKNQNNYPIQQHPEYEKLMDQYACKVEACGETKYMPCPSCPTQESKRLDQEIKIKEAIRRALIAERENCPKPQQAPPICSEEKLVTRDEYDELRREFKMLKTEKQSCNLKPISPNANCYAGDAVLLTRNDPSIIVRPDFDYTLL